MKKYKKELIIAVISLILFALVTIFVFAIGSQQFDTDVFNAVAKLRNDFFIPFFKVVTFIASKYFTIILVVILPFVLWNRNKSTYKKFMKNEKGNNFLNLIKPWLIFGLAVAAVTILFFIIKFIFQRDRPFDWFLVFESGHSFPSGHTATAVTMYGTISLLLNYTFDKKWLKVLTTTLTSIIVVLVGISRIFLGVHYTTDVIAGLFLGIFVISFVSIAIKAMDARIDYRKADATHKKEDNNVEQQKERVC